MKTIIPGIPALPQLFAQAKPGHPTCFYGNVIQEPGAHDIGDVPWDKDLKHAAMALRYLHALDSTDIAFIEKSQHGFAKQQADYQQDILARAGLPHSTIKPENIFPCEFEQHRTLATILQLGLQPGDMKDFRHLPFSYSDESNTITDHLGGDIDTRDINAVVTANNKGLALKGMEAYGIPVPMGDSPNTTDEALSLFDDLMARGAKSVFLKVNRSVAGMGIFQITKRNELEAKLAEPRIQEHMATPGFGIRLDYGLDLRSENHSPNFMIFVRPDCIFFIGASYQILQTKPGDKIPSVHIGNKGPVSAGDLHLLQDIAFRVGNWMHAIGAYGMAGVDCVITNTDRGIVPRHGKAQHAAVAEINYRLNGNTGALLLASELQFPFWGTISSTAANAQFTLSKFDRAVGANVLSKNGGILPIGIGTFARGDIQTAHFAHSAERLERFFEATIQAGMDTL